MAHTKGPWYRRGPLHEDECGVAGGIDVDVVISGGEDDDELVSILDALTVADADLIAAAPELLDALKALRALSDTEQPKKFDAAMAWIENDRLVRQMVDAAIAKAEGK